MVNYVIYSHSSYSDILQIQTDYMINLKNKILFIDKNDMDLSHIYKNYDKVIFYDGSDVYGKRLMDCLNQIDIEDFVFIHDNDILIHVDLDKLNKFFSCLRENNYDRIDFQLSWPFHNTKRHLINDNGVYLVKQDDINEYIYNVNPSIWKRSALLEIVTNFKHRCYRSIESIETQIFAKKFNVFKLYSNDMYRCGFFVCTEPFRYLHLTHEGKISKPDYIGTELYTDVIHIYNEIVDKYQLQHNNKWKS